MVSLSVDKHRLRVYNTSTGNAAAESIIDSARVTALCWCAHIQSGPEGEAEALPPNKKRRKKRSSQIGSAASDGSGSQGEQIVALGLADGTLQFFSPKHARVIWTLSHPTCSSPILDISINEDDGSIWTSSADGNIRRWDAQQKTMTASYKYNDRTPYPCLAIRPGVPEDNHAHVLAANYGIHLLLVPTSDDDITTESSGLDEVASFTGHASPVTCLLWDSKQRFVSMAERDRHVYVWDTLDEPPEDENISSTGKPAASIPLDSDARVIALSASPTRIDAAPQNLLTLSASGKISLFSIPPEITSLRSNSKHKVPTLEPLSNISISSKRSDAHADTINASFIPSEEGRIRVVRLVGGVRPIFSVVDYLDESGNFKQSISIVSDDAVLESAAHASTNGVVNKRYNERSSIAVASGVDLGQDASMDDLPVRELDGDLDVNVAELSLGERLTALSGADDAAAPGSASDSENPAAGPESRSRTGKRDDPFHIVPANSLTRTLIQALHSSDSPLLETCLAHSDNVLIRNTVQRLPPQLAVPLLNACVERLSRGPRANNMKGGGGGASAQRGMALITWVKSVLTIHSGHLMTMPDLVARLSGLHTTVASRLSLHESLLLLNGRLDMVLSQVEMRSSAAPAPVAARKRSQGANKEKAVKRYVEGESDEADDQMDVEVESGDDAGSIEDVELGGESEDEEDDDEDEGQADSESDEEGGPTSNGFIDDEAEEDFEEDEEDDYSE